MTNGKPRAARFLGARAIRKDAIILTLCAFLIVAPMSQRSINAAPPPQTEPARNQLLNRRSHKRRAANTRNIRRTKNATTVRRHGAGAAAGRPGADGFAEQPDSRAGRGRHSRR